MSYTQPQPLLVASTSGAPANADWVTLYEIEARARYDAEVAIRTYVQSPKQSLERNYDDRLHVRIGCGKTMAYELLKAYERGEEGGLRHKRVGNKYIIPEMAVREWENSQLIGINYLRVAR